MMINKAVLHIFDFNTNVCVVSQKDLDFSSDVVYEYVSKRLNRIIGDAAQKTGVFYATSAFQMKLQALADGTMTFDDLASQTARELYQLLAHCDEPESTDLLVIDFQDDDDVRNVGILMLENKTAYTHQILDDEGTVYNKLIKHYAILPGTAQKADAYALIRLSDFSIHFVDKKRKMDGEDVYLLPDKLLQCTSVISSKEAVKVVSKIAEKVAEEHGASTVEALSKAKTYLVENAETADSFSPQDLAAMSSAIRQCCSGNLKSKSKKPNCPRPWPSKRNMPRKPAAAIKSRPIRALKLPSFRIHRKYRFHPVHQ